MQETLQLSAHNIIGPVKDSDDWFIINPLYGEADIITADIAAALQAGIIPEHEKEELISKHYLANPQEETKAFRRACLDFIDHRDSDEKQVFFVPWYSCNFNCAYCYQSGYDPERTELDDKTIEAFFDYLQKKFAGARYYITLFGGEPLLPGDAHYRMISSFLKKAGDTPLAIVTNGYALDRYLPLLHEFHSKIREIQLTLDGTANIHNSRRPLYGGAGTFEKIAENLGLCLEYGYEVNLRVVVDRENIGNIPALADYAIAKGWTSSPLFKTQFGRNYELHYCQSAQSKLYDRIDMWSDIYALIKEHPQVLEFHKPAFSVAKYLFENGILPDPLFDSCPACKTEWAFDYTGRIYSCTATVGKEGESLGTFYPVISEDTEAIEAWQDRDVTAISACRTCAHRLICGGGCGAVAKNRTGNISGPDCRPAAQLLEYGIALYRNDATG
ncbi:MAG: radical SAM protein [Spirochaetales bacterium]|nr:radical SAM protein [Spirochaetales bacterium]